MPIQLTEPAPFEEAVERLEERTPIASALRTLEWSAVPQALRDRAFFSARVEDANLLGEMRDRIQKALELDPTEAFEDRAKFVSRIRQTLGAAPGDSGALTDISSRRRLELIYDMNVEEAYEAGRYRAGQQSAILYAFPARELVRIESRQEPRAWRTRWQTAGGQFYADRMIARKDSPIWRAISRFGRPYPPFDFGSGMGVEDVEREEAIELGVIAPDETPEPEIPGYNEKLEAGARFAANDPIARRFMKTAFGDQVDLEGDRAIWKGDQAA